MEFPIFQFVPIASLILSLGSTEKYLAVSSLFYKILLSLFFSWLCNHSSLTLFSCQLPQSFNDLHGLSVDLLECAHVLRSPGQDSTAGVSLLCWGEGNRHLPGPAGTALPDAAQDAVGFFATRMHYRLSFSLLPMRTWFSLCLEIVSRIFGIPAEWRKRFEITLVETTWL